MDLIKTPAWRKIIQSLAEELKTQVRIEGNIYGHTPRFQELRAKIVKHPFASTDEVHYEQHTIENTPIIAGPFRKKEQYTKYESLAEAYKHLPLWCEEYAKIIELSIKHAVIASQETIRRRKSPDNERLLFSYWQNVRKAKSIEDALSKTVQFLVNHFKAGNVSIKLRNHKAEHFALTPALQRAEQIILPHVHDTKTPCVINTQHDILLKEIKDKSSLPATITAFPLVKNRTFLGVVFIYGGQVPKLSEVEEVLNEFLESLNRVEEYEQVQESAVTDPLTGLYNRNMLVLQLEKLINQLSQAKNPISILMLDADNFKNYNDTYGHPAGDEVLKKISKVMKSLTPDDALTCRYGGEEFLIAIPKLDQKQAKSFAEKLRETIEKECPLTVSIGMLTCMNSSGSSQTMIKEADNALYRAKHLGKNKVIARIMLDKYLGIVDG